MEKAKISKPSSKEIVKTEVVAKPKTEVVDFGDFEVKATPKFKKEMRELNATGNIAVEKFKVGSAMYKYALAHSKEVLVARATRDYQ